MKHLEITSISVSDRQRKEIAPKALLELKRSILSKGLLHAIVVTSQNELLAGGRRLQAMTELHEEGHQFLYNGQPVPSGYVPTTSIAELTPVEVIEAELEENIIRVDLTWLEEAEAKAKIHEMRGELQPETTYMDTAKYIAEKTGAPEPSSRKRHEIAQSVLVSKNKDNPRVKAAKSLEEAYKGLLDQAEVNFKANLVRRTETLPSKNTCILGDCRLIMPTLQANTYDLIFSDPPYGIGADSQKGDSKHFYDDSPERAMDINKFIISDGFRVSKLQGSLLLFCDVESFIPLREYCQQQGWTTWRTPLIWYKGLIGSAPWGRAGFTRTYEMMLYAVKGAKELYSPGGADTMTYPRVSRSEQQHAAEKPSMLLHHLLSRLCIEGDHILDPCCGSGSLFPVANRLKLQVTGIELDPDYHNRATSRLFDVDDPPEESKPAAQKKEDAPIDLKDLL